MQSYIKKINFNARLGLWGSVVAVIITGAFIFASPWRFYQTPQVSRAMLIAGSVLAILAVSMSLLTVRKQLPRLRQADDLAVKLSGYASHITSFYRSIFVVVLILCVLTLLSGRNVLLPLTMVTTLMLFLAYPNIYRMKVLLGLTEEEMRAVCAWATEDIGMTVVEVGTLFGLTARELGWQVVGGRVIAVDNFSWNPFGLPP